MATSWTGRSEPTTTWETSDNRLTNDWDSMTMTWENATDTWETYSNVTTWTVRTSP